MRSFFKLTFFSVFATGFLASQAPAQSNTVWRLEPVIANGVVVKPPYYPSTFTVHHVDIEGGKVQARVEKPGKPECFALFDYGWTFSHPLDVVNQDDIFEVKIELSANPASSCPPPLDPLMSVSPIRGRTVNGALAGKFGHGGPELILFHPKTPASNGRIDVPNSQSDRNAGDVYQFKVDDTRTSHGGNMDATRGAFKFHLGYRGAVYEIYYTFSAP